MFLAWTAKVGTAPIDRTAARADLEVHLNDPHTLAILCSGFNNAPSAEARLLLERAKEAGVRHLTLKAALLALPRPEEAMAVKDDAGERVETVEEGYDLKGDQVRTTLEPMGLQDLSIAFFNAREDGIAATCRGRHGTTNRLVHQMSQLPPFDDAFREAKSKA